MKIVWSSLCCAGLSLAGCVPPDAEDVGATTASQTQALSESHCPPNVPAALAPAADQALWRVFGAEGVQIYRCTAGAAGPAWVLEAPDAVLMKDGDVDEDGDRRLVGHHYAGPTWEYKDRSAVVGVRVASAPSPVAGAIPWLLLTAASHVGTGAFSEVTSIQRLDTAGGAAPATGCDAATVGASVRVPYSADYFFYRTRAGNNDRKQCP